VQPVELYRSSAGFLPIFPITYLSVKMLKKLVLSPGFTAGQGLLEVIWVVHTKIPLIMM
jgi:hypothetical protein